MNGMNLSGNPGMVQPIQMPPTFGQPPIPFIQPRCPTLHCTTGPQQPNTMPGFPDKFMPFMDQTPGSLLSSKAVMTYGKAIHALRRSDGQPWFIHGVAFDISSPR